MTDSAFSVLTLNISRPPKDRAAALLEYLWHREDDILVLTETGRGEGSALIAPLATTSTPACAG